MKQNLYALAFALLSTTGALAQEGGGIKPLSAKNAASDYHGDTISFPVHQKAKVVLFGSTDMPKDGCLYAGTNMKGIGQAEVATGEKGQGASRSLFVVGENKPTEGAPSETDCPNPVASGSVVALDPQMLDIAHARSGWTYGTLVVPYKFQYSGDRSISGGATLGAYVGRRVNIPSPWGLSSLSAQVVGFAGLTKVDVQSEAEGKSKTDQLAGISYGVGLLTTVKQAFQVGLVVGADRVAKSANYVNNGKTWISLSVGYAFSQ